MSTIAPITFVQAGIDQETALARDGWPRFSVAELTEWWNEHASLMRGREAGPWGASNALRRQGLRAADAWDDFYGAWNPRGDSLLPGEIDAWTRAVRRLASALDTTARTPGTWDVAKEATGEVLRDYGRRIHAASPTIGRLFLGIGIAGAGYFMFTAARRWRR